MMRAQVCLACHYLGTGFIIAGVSLPMRHILSLLSLFLLACYDAARRHFPNSSTLTLHTSLNLEP